MDNIIAALEHNDRVCQIDIDNLTISQLGYVANSAAIVKPFPELTGLRLTMFVDDEPGPIPPDLLLGGTAPRLQSLKLDRVPFPGLSKLLFSATHLVRLEIYNIPRSGYIPPEVMATSLCALNSLEHLHFRFLHPRLRLALESLRLPPPPPTRSILPGLTAILFKGASEYLEEILARIDAPRLDQLHITFFNQIIFDKDNSLFQFITRNPTLRVLEEGRIAFNSKAIIVELPSQTFGYNTLCAVSEWQLSSLEQVCTSSLPPISTLEDLYIYEYRDWLQPCWQDDVENPLWLELLHVFASVKNLYVSEEFVPRIAPALQELVGGRTTEVLPSLENIFLEGF